MVKEANDIAEMYNTNLSELVRDSHKQIIEEKKKDIYYRLTHGVDECDIEESKEILKTLSKLKPEELEIVETEDVYKHL